MPTLQEILGALSAQAGPRGSTFAGRVVPQGERPSLRDLMSQLPTETPDAEGMGSLVAAAGMAKQFKPGAKTIQDMVKRMAENADLLPPRERLVPAIRVPTTGEVFGGSVGGQHPTETVIQAMTQRKQAVPGTLQFGFQRPGEEVFIPEQVTGMMRSSDALQRLRGLFEKGIDLDTIIETLKAGK